MNLHRVLPVLGVPVSNLTLDDVLDQATAMIAERRPDFFATANLDHAMRCRTDERLRDALCAARFVTADGMPLVWMSQWNGTGLFGRVTGSDLLPRLAELAASCGFRVFLLGGPPGMADRAAARLIDKFPALQIAGTYCPEFAPLEQMDHGRMCDAIRRARPDILFTSLGSPKGTFWIADHLEEIQVPVCVEIGAALALASGESRRAPRWMQRTGCEWAYRLFQEPGRLFDRYRANAGFLLSEFVRQSCVFPISSSAQASHAQPSLKPGETPQACGEADSRTSSERRQAIRSFSNESETWSVAKAIARRIARSRSVIASLAGSIGRPEELVGAIVSLHRLATRRGVDLEFRGLAASIRTGAGRLGGPLFASWLTAASQSRVQQN